MFKHNCCRCAIKAVWFYPPKAVWFYLPSDGNKVGRPIKFGPEVKIDRYFCDTCVSRGCSCNLIGDDSFEQYKDIEGRLLPCVEYDYNENGYWNDTILGKAILCLINAWWYTKEIVRRMGAKQDG